MAVWKEGWIVKRRLQGQEKVAEHDGVGCGVDGLVHGLDAMELQCAVFAMAGGQGFEAFCDFSEQVAFHRGA